MESLGAKPAMACWQPPLAPPCHEESWIDWLKTGHLSSNGVGEGHTV